jgi:hypothetical protein
MDIETSSRFLKFPPLAGRLITMVILSANDCRCVVNTGIKYESGVMPITLIYLVSEVTLVSGDVFYIHYS